MRKVGKWASASMLSWAVCLGAGIIWAAATPRSDSDWFGGRVLVPVAIAFVAGTVVSTALATISLFKSERGVGWAWLLATPPLLLFLALGAWYVSAQQQEKLNRQAAAAANAYLEQIVADPQIVLAQHWADTHDARLNVLLASLSSNNRVPYTEAQLRQLYDEAPVLRPYVFQHPAASAQFIREHFDEAFELARTTSSSMLDSMRANPNFPEDLRRRLPQDRQ